MDTYRQAIIRAYTNAGGERITMAETLSMVSMVSFVAAGVCLALTVMIVVCISIPNVIGDLSGRNARKSIEECVKVMKIPEENLIDPVL